MFWIFYGVRMGVFLISRAWAQGWFLYLQIILVFGGESFFLEEIFGLLLFFPFSLFILGEAGRPSPLLVVFILDEAGRPSPLLVMFVLDEAGRPSPVLVVFILGGSVRLGPFGWFVRVFIFEFFGISFCFVNFVTFVLWDIVGMYWVSFDISSL
jgi:hypothetical protein